ncbi:MAG: hypothetical protein HKN11_03505 [Rhizobiales bacterium]|nr:hypothetical protein [Hyphomicrobiales bacterium]
MQHGSGSTALPHACRIERRFCNDCGSSLFARYSDIGEFWVKVGSLDQPQAALPQRHMCIESQLSWHVIADRLPRVRSKEQPRAPGYRGAAGQRDA